MADYTAYFNGEWVPYSQVSISPTDRGFTVGDVVFDVARTFNGKSYRMKEHVDRLYRSLNVIRLDPGISVNEMMEASEEVIRRNEHLRAEVGDFTVRQFVTRGPGEWSRDAGPPTVCISVAGVSYDRFARFFKSGAHGVIARTRSYSSDSVDPKIKHYSRMNFNMADIEAGDVDSESWPILTDSNGNLSEGTGYNFFMVTNGVIRTPGDQSILQGVSRMAVFDLAKQLGIPVVEEELQPYDLYTADEAFFSGTSYFVLPMTKVDNRIVSDGKPGPITQQLMAALSESVGVDLVDQALSFSSS